MTEDSIFGGKRFDPKDLEDAVRRHPAGKAITDKDAQFTPTEEPRLTPAPKPKKIAQHLKRVR